MDVAPVRGHIEELVAEEHRLRESHAGRPLEPDQQAHLDAVVAELDACWDVLRRRRAGQPDHLDDAAVPDPPS